MIITEKFSVRFQIENNLKSELKANSTRLFLEQALSLSLSLSLSNR